MVEYFTRLAIYFGESQELLVEGELDRMIATAMEQQDHDKDGFLTQDEYMLNYSPVGNKKQQTKHEL